MKHQLLVFLSIIAFSFTSLAQAPPNGFNYSAVARDASGQPIISSTIGIQISILKTSTTGEILYTENHLIATDAFGLFNLIIGGGAIQSGNMSTIDWSSDNFFLQVSMDAAGGTNFTLVGTTQLLSVPYAMHAKTAESVVGGGNGTGFTHYVGEQFGGGVVFHVWKEADGVEHALIVDLVNLATEEPWSNLYNVAIGALLFSSFDGLSNSELIINQPGHTNSAASMCLDSNNGGYTDWYLPAPDELSLVWQNRYHLNKTLASIPGANTIDNYGWYWCSHEQTATTAWFFNIATSSAGAISKGTFNFVRAVRKI